MNNQRLTHTRSITRTHRTAYIMLLDLSSSMMDITTSDERIVTKGEVLIEGANRVLDELYMRAFRNGEMNDYYDIAVVGYSGGSVYSLLTDSATSPFMSIRDLHKECLAHRWVNLRSLTPINSPLDATRAEASTIVLQPEGSTPTYEALYTTYEVLKRWCADPRNRESFPPTLVHLSDGHPTDCSLDAIVEMSNRIKSLSTEDGEVLLLNIQIESLNRGSQLLFPSDAEIEAQPSRYVESLAKASSLMPRSFYPYIEECRKGSIASEYRGFGYGLSVVDVMAMMNIGTLSAVVK